MHFVLRGMLDLCHAAAYVAFQSLHVKEHNMSTVAVTDATIRRSEIPIFQLL